MPKITDQSVGGRLILTLLQLFKAAMKKFSQKDEENSKEEF